jgi:hypothetical protein
MGILAHSSFTRAINLDYAAGPLRAGASRVRIFALNPSFRRHDVNFSATLQFRD